MKCVILLVIEQQREVAGPEENLTYCFPELDSFFSVCQKPKTLIQLKEPLHIGGGGACGDRQGTGGLG